MRRASPPLRRMLPAIRLPNVNVGFYVTGVDNFQTSSTPTTLAKPTSVYYHAQSGNYSVIAVDPWTETSLSRLHTPAIGLPRARIAPSSTGGTITVSIIRQHHRHDAECPSAQWHGRPIVPGYLRPSPGPKLAALGPSPSPTPISRLPPPPSARSAPTFVQLSATDARQFGMGAVHRHRSCALRRLTSARLDRLSGLWLCCLRSCSHHARSGSNAGERHSFLLPTNNTNNVTVLNANVTGSGQIGTLDTTMLANGSYWIQMQATDTNSNSAIQPCTRHRLRQLQAGPRHGHGDRPGCSRHRSGHQDPTHLRQPQCRHERRLRLWMESRHQCQSHRGPKRQCHLHARRAAQDLLSDAYLSAVGFFPYYFVAFTPEPGLYGTLTDSGSGLPARHSWFPTARFGSAKAAAANTTRPATSTPIPTAPRTPSAPAATCSRSRIAAATA